MPREHNDEVVESGGAIALTYNQITPAPAGADCVLRLSFKKNGKPVARARILLRDVHTGMSTEVTTEEDGNVFLPMVATGPEMRLFASSSEPFAETWVRLYFDYETPASDDPPDSAGGSGKKNKWGIYR